MVISEAPAQWAPRGKQKPYLLCPLSWAEFLPISDKVSSADLSKVLYLICLNTHLKITTSHVPGSVRPAEGANVTSRQGAFSWGEQLRICSSHGDISFLPSVLNNQYFRDHQESTRRRHRKPFSSRQAQSHTSPFTQASPSQRRSPRPIPKPEFLLNLSRAPSFLSIP